MRINHNISAMNTYRQYSTNAASANKSMEKLSSGSRINRAADDAAGLSISEKMRSQIRGLTQAKRNAEDGVSFLQTAEGALTEVSDMLTRLKELAVQVQNGTYSDDDKANIGAEMNALGKAITDIYVNTKFNGIHVFGEQTVASANGAGASQEITTGTAMKGKELSTADFVIKGSLMGEDGVYSTGETITGTAPAVGESIVAADIHYGEDGNQKVSIIQATTKKVATLVNKALMAGTSYNATGSDVGTVAQKALNATLVTVADVEAAITEVNTTRATYGAQQNQLEHATNNMSTTKENLQSAESRVRDVDMAEEMMEYTKDNILLQAAQAMLAQANSQPQGILQLLR